ncbi:dipeptidase [Pleionea sediminis]|uniref:dipeptidase n=1 Tax=Pleionea sediminis TaxID=2569479 RepID=UPI001186B3B3|nr:dipeptidase [Pleionea sediminis]
MRIILLFIIIAVSPLATSKVSPQAKKASEYAAKEYLLAAENALAEMISFKTVADPAVPYLQDKNFINFRKWLKTKAQSLGLETEDHGYVVTISLGQGEKVLGLITHGDVQPANPAKWKKNPFSLDRESAPDKLIGRGTEDDKGPIAAALYAMKAIKDKGYPLKGKVELLIYMAEESDWEPLKEFLKTYEPAPVNIAFDSDYPVVIAEKAWSHINVAFPTFSKSEKTNGPAVLSFKGGAFRSQIPEDAIAEVTGITSTQLADIRYQLRQYPIQFETTAIDDSIIISVKGKAAHSSTPQHGINAVNILAESLKVVNWADSAPAFAIKYLNELVGVGIEGKKFGNLAYTHTFMGPMTLSPTQVKFNDKNELEVFINVRRPFGKTKDQVTRDIQKALDKWKEKSQIPLIIKDIYVGDPLWVKDAPHTETLLNVYSYFTKTQNPKPAAIGGSTNAKLFPNAVSFGPSLPDAEYTGHSEYEFMTRKTFELTLKMYTAVILELTSQ